MNRKLEFRVGPNLYKRIIARMMEEDYSVSEFIRRCIEKELENEKPGIVSSRSVKVDESKTGGL